MTKKDYKLSYKELHKVSVYMFFDENIYVKAKGHYICCSHYILSSAKQRNL